MKKRERNPLQHSFDILAIIGAAEEPLAASQIAELMRVHKSTVSRLLTALNDRGLVERDPASLRYRLGPEMIAIAGAALQGNTLSEVAQPVLDDIARETRETVTLSIWNRDHAVDIAVSYGLEQVSYTPKLGLRNPAHCTATGKVFLAAMKPEKRERLLEFPLKKFTVATLTTKKALNACLEEVARTGVAWNKEELSENLCTVAVPVVADADVPRAALGISVPKFRFGAEKRELCVGALKRGAASIAARLTPRNTSTA
jgi:DNA-binding IclR family transcriptional regulator